MASQCAQQALAPYLQYKHDSDSATHLSAGKSDGAAERPAEIDTELGAYENTVLTAAVTATQHYRSCVDSDIQSKEADREEKRQSLDEQLATARANLLQQQGQELALLNQTQGKASSKYGQFEKLVKQTEESLDRIKLDVGHRPVQSQLVKGYIYILAILALVEIPINSQAFAFAFSQTPKISYVLAFGIGVFFIYMAHICGWMLRTSGNEPGQKSPSKQYPVIAGAVLFILIVMYFLGMVRKSYLDFLGTSGGDLEIMRSLGLIDVVTESASEWASVLSDPNALTFLLMNVAVFVVGAFLAFFRHDPHPDYEKVLTDNQKVANSLADLDAEFGRLSIATQKKFRDEIERLEKKQEAERKILQELVSQINSLKSQKRDEIQLVRDVVFQMLLAYQQGNEQARSTPKPSYFGATTQTLIHNTITS